MSKADFEAKWLARFNELLDDLKSDNPDIESSSAFGPTKRLFDLITGFAKEAKDLSLKEEDFNMDPLPFEFVKNKGGLLPKKHLNPFEAAEHYRDVVGAAVEEHQHIKQDRDEKRVNGWESITDEMIDEVHELVKGVKKAKEDGLWPPERMPRRKQVVDLEEHLQWMSRVADGTEDAGDRPILMFHTSDFREL